MSLLEIRDLKVCYGGIVALDGISFDVNEHEIVTLIGANGAGKSTTLRSIMGLVPLSGGTITYDGEVINGLDTQKIVQKGIVLVPEGRRVFPNLTTLENLKIGAYLQDDKTVEPNLKKVYELFPRLEERHWQQAGTLSGGEQQMLAVGRALMANPRVIMMDEPSLGLAPLVVKDIFSIIKKINDAGVTVLLIEQNANVALKTADRGYVMETGTVSMTGPGRELLEDEAIKFAYLGKTR
ncbi:ABC-type branched-chain amino acid transport systems, ATPase component [Sphaerochaeta pleomorpha str. Grapes]|uniref:ABC-type branched-chain amino acid transport systems, ATPase component n=1 Tax=Sphaerochaeta pleomorpha (strain ATCC BAA-1885 / DSM 22778 / Grapes) TaxID=158190 RepID=G8QUE8_SPHPG|nr:ABC transporter ATP-binding protein [Sphaerochaeta pleomorpha]AEV29181.1 ABC-type branched-chain amino acid transport systems, ATPase component [Sphaerochaeta pleomorpha str. Grapes]